MRRRSEAPGPAAGRQPAAPPTGRSASRPGFGTRWLLAAAALLAVLAGACGGGKEDPPGAAGEAWTSDVLAHAAPGEGTAARVTIAAASDLRAVLEELRPTLEDTCETTMTVSYGSSGQLAGQISAGAPFALFLSADRQYPEQLATEGLVAPGGMARYGRGRLALVAREGLPAPESLDDLADARFRTIAIANPAHAPYGRAARQALEQSGVLPGVQSRLVIAENVRQALEYVETGNADAGLVALALLSPGARQAARPVDASLHEPIEQAGAVISGSGAQRTARCLLQYLLDPPGQAALKRYGFEPAETP